MDETVETTEADILDQYLLTPQQEELVKLSRSIDQLNHGYVQGATLDDIQELKDRVYEIGKKNNTRVLDSDLMGFDETNGEFEHGHMTEPDRRERTGRDPMVRGRGAYCTLVDEDKKEYINVVDFDNPNDKVFLSEKQKELMDFIKPSGKNVWKEYKIRTVILMQGEAPKL